MMIAHDPTALLAAFQNTTQEQLTQHLDMMAQSMGEKTFCQNAAAHLVSLARPDKAIPASLTRFIPMVRDGIEFFLSRISYPRLRQAILSQSRLPLDSSPGERLLHLALQFPSLHKFGQIIARNPGLDPQLKRWLIQLEKGDYHTDQKERIQQISRELAKSYPNLKISLAHQILAEASVAAILPFTLATEERTDSHPGTSGVFKVLKAEIEEQLKEELLILENTAAFFEKNRERYGLQEMMIGDLFAEVRNHLAREIDLVAEQQNLVEAAKMYSDLDGIIIPALFSFSTPGITSMEFIKGTRITNTGLSQKQRNLLARRTFEAIICIPLFSIKEQALFHGDPHAGNILAVPGGSTDGTGVALIDWTLSGHLPRDQRSHIMEMMVGLMTEDVMRICKAISQMITGTGRQYTPEWIKKRISDLVASQNYRSDPLKMAFWLLEELTMDGLVFSAELLLFRKAFFTLEGVLRDVAPGFSMGHAMENYIGRLLLEEIPLRIGANFLLMPDESRYYRTLLSNQALRRLSSHHAISAWRKALTASSTLMEIQTKMASNFLSGIWKGTS